MALPTNFLLKSNANSKYLLYSRESADVTHLRFSKDEDEKMSDISYLKFEIQSAKVGGGLVHIKVTRSHKYLVRKSAESNYLVAEASEPEEDRTLLSSTLFKLILLGADNDKSKKIQLVHIDRLGERYAYMSESEGDLVLRDEASSGTDDNNGVFTLYDADSVVILPDFVAFVASNTSIGASRSDIRKLFFYRNDSIGTEGVTQAVHQYPLKRQVQFTNMSNQVHWTLSSEEDGMDIVKFANKGDPILALEPIKLDGNAIALLCRNTNLYLSLNIGRPSIGPLLCAGDSNIDHDARFMLKEPVLHRKITDVTYDLDNCRIYDVGSTELFSDSHSNKTSVDQTRKFKVEHVHSKTMTWNDSVTISTGVKVTVDAGVPLIYSGGIEISASASMTFEWGAGVVKKETMKSEYPVTAKPGYKAVLQVTASKARCDVPFKCNVRDTLPDGTFRNYTKEGVFKGANQYNIVDRVKEYPLPAPLKPPSRGKSSNTD